MAAVIALLLAAVPMLSPAGTVDAAKQAAQSAATSNSNCTSLALFYWEIGDRNGPLSSGSRGLSPPTANTTVPLYSAGKWLYAAYVLEKRGSQPLSLTDTRALTMQAGYTDQGQCNVVGISTVAQCLNSIGTFTASAVDRFSYGPGHFQKHAVAEMNLGGLNNAALATEIISGLGGGFALTYSAPQPAGGARSAASDYAIFLRKLLNRQLLLSNKLGSNAVCTYSPDPNCNALSSPSSNDAVNISEPWHYSLGHWIEDAPGIGDGAFSSPGASGFYPWVDADLQYYGLLVRNVLAASSAGDSAKCGRQIRKAFLDTLGPEAGVCGTANGSTTSTYPGTGLCGTGSAQAVDQSGNDGSFNWNCKGYRGGATVACAAIKPIPVTGTCGGANGVGVPNYPGANHCATGSKTDTDTLGNDGAFNWSCFGSNGGGNATCSAPKLVATNGACGSANGQGSAMYPSSALCANGTALNNDTSGTDGSFNWTCPGSNGGIDASCAAPKLLNGQCGTASGLTTQNYPAANHCTVGTLQSTDTSAADNTFNWSCNGAGGGTNASCSAPKQLPAVDGSCGSANAVGTRDYPLGGLCAAGTPADGDTGGGDGNFNWSCAGSNGGNAVQCSAAKISDGACGNAAAVSTAVYPIAQHCLSGTRADADTAGSDGDFNWNCAGINGGTSAACVAPKQAAGACGSSANVGTASYPGTGLCASGPATQIDGIGTDGHFDWSCPGANGGSGANCSAPRSVNGQCGAAQGSTTASYPTSAHCAVGNTTLVDGIALDGSFNWSCSGVAGGTAASCAATKPVAVNGQCGAALGVSTAAYPATDLCLVGTPTATDSAAADGSFNWTCGGQFGGTTTGCAAPIAASVSGVCGAAHNQPSAGMPNTGLCASGSTVITDGGGGDGSFNWTCSGANGGSSQSCTAPQQFNPPPPTEPPSGDSGGGGAFGPRELLVLLSLAIGALRRRRIARS